jgi:hypothetical protein
MSERWLGTHNMLSRWIPRWAGSEDAVVMMDRRCELLCSVVGDVAGYDDGRWMVR